jgi:serine/threonine protein kinase
MSWVALNCPQCSAPLPRVALWRAVKCASCGALITKTESMVMRESFRQALNRARHAGGDIQCAGERYLLLELLGTGEISKVYLARRIGAIPYLATIKLSSASTAHARYAREAMVLRELHAISSLLPEVVAQGPLEDDSSRQALVLAHPTGFWGSLADLRERFAQGIDPRHAVWIWRRMLDILRFIHAQGWSHGDVRPEHALVHPEDHAVRLISWGSAQKNPRHQSMDLLQSAKTTAALLPHSVPPALGTLLTRANQDEAFCRQQGAQGLDDLLRAAAHEAFGPPSFVPLNI